MAPSPNWDLLSVENAEAVPKTPLTGNGQSYVLVGVKEPREYVAFHPCYASTCMLIGVDP
jgi:hypothetical protein